jgi:hypothetical protein
MAMSVPVAHGNTHLCLRQCWSVIHTIARHTNSAAFLLVFSHGSVFIVG